MLAASPLSLEPLASLLPDRWQPPPTALFPTPEARPRRAFCLPGSLAELHRDDCAGACSTERIRPLDLRPERLPPNAAHRFAAQYWQHLPGALRSGVLSGRIR